MRIKLIKRQILDEREEQLVNKAGMESFSLMLCGSLALYMGSVAMNGGVVHYQPFLLLILITSFFSCVELSIWELIIIIVSV